MKMDKNRNIILVGYMGSGKSTIGRKAAKALGFEFLDTDILIEQIEGMPISRLFEEKGEPYFREKETDVIRELLSEPKGKIIATGGGLPMTKGNPELLKELGTVIYLKADSSTLVKRLSGDTTRPLLQNGELEEKIKSMLAVRGPVYEQLADVVFVVDTMSVYEAICKIEKMV